MMIDNVIKISTRSHHIRKLSQLIVNQIAAGEVVERPASVIKELIENSIDAGAKKIEVSIVDGGKSFISVKDDGCGINIEDLPLAFERHATSKLSNENLFDISTFGFRGEALASISSIARVTIQSKFVDDNNSYSIRSNENGISDVFPSSLSIGTLIEVSDLFYATPARLKFLKSTAAEADACSNIIQNIAMCHHEIAFKYVEDRKVKFDYKIANDRSERLSSIFGNDFSENTSYVENISQDLSVKAFLGVPNYNKATSSYMRFFVNGRYIKDKQLMGVIKSAYKEVVPSGRFPVCVLFLNLRNDLIDVNVHPAKTEIRFRDFDAIKGILYSTIKKTISEKIGQNASSALVRMGLKQLHDEAKNIEQSSSDNFKTLIPLFTNEFSKDNHSDFKNVSLKMTKQFESPASNERSIFVNNEKFLKHDSFDIDESLCDFQENSQKFSEQKYRLDLGQSIAQIDLKYIVAKNKNNELIIVDQHAVCERINLEKLLNRKSLESQQLLIPEVIVTSKARVEIVMAYLDILKSFGILIEKMSFDTICLRGVPAIFAIDNPKEFLIDIVDELEGNGTIDSFEEKIRLIFSTISCHNSIRAGKILTQVEMDSILRQAEQTANIAQCCHGRPSYIILNIKTLDSLFER